jgi:hypothetical protein
LEDAGSRRGRSNKFYLNPLLARPNAKPDTKKIHWDGADMENRIKKCLIDLFADRTTMRANQLFLW